MDAASLSEEEEEVNCCTVLAAQSAEETNYLALYLLDAVSLAEHVMDCKVLAVLNATSLMEQMIELHQWKRFPGPSVANFNNFLTTQRDGIFR